jgi:hypothetical protein
MSAFYRVFCIFLLFFSIFSAAFAEKTPSAFKSAQKKQATRAQEAQAAQWNEEVQRVNETIRLEDERPLRPVPDFAPFKYLLMSGATEFNSTDIKKKIAQNLPPEVKLILLVMPGDEASTRSIFKRWISEDRLIIATQQSANNGFWARDAYPYPVYMNTQLDVNLIAAKYDREFSAHKALVKAIGAESIMRQYKHVFVGGNLLSDQNGRCFVVESGRLYKLKDKTLIDSYGCQEVVRLEHTQGIGDVDEVIKILPNKRVLTNDASYVKKLESLGYQVTMLPKLSNYRTYANSIMFGNLVFMPKFNVPADLEAQQVYESFGYKVIAADSISMSTEGMGSIHCATMAYPEIDLSRLMRMLGAKIL